ncbi:ligase-associated DNA damage response endonuclease PdeM [Acidovorax sp. SDU_ACID1]|uniref:ligase-associated DNA damage response endonuclease PdeM n=1 Tax=Acidovorax sp. SDU_ACID1 TaxID=3136632 RepID=UPI003872BFBA
MHIELPLADTTVHLLPEGALWWPEGAALCIADLHLGKAATFRARGLPVPHGTTRGNLDRLAWLLARYPQARRLVVLGDFLHAAESHAHGVLNALAAWREGHPALEVVLVRGNHDSHAGDPPPWLDARIVDEPWPLGPFACCHHPQRHPERWVLAGHLHPAAVLRGSGRDALRVPCFLSEPGLLVLPAFGEFTGGYTVGRAPGRRLFAVAAGQVWALP